MQDRRPFKLVEEDHWIAGVCGGIAYSFGWPVLWVRIVVAVLVLGLSNPYVVWIGEFLVVSYIIAWIFAPDWEKDPRDYKKRTA